MQTLHDKAQLASGFLSSRLETLAGELAAILGAASAIFRPNPVMVAIPARGMATNAAVCMHVRPVETGWYTETDFGKKYSRFQRWRVAS